MAPERVVNRAFTNMKVVDECWLSKYSTIRGYPQIGWHDDEGKPRRALIHRIAWEAANGPIPDDMTVDHMRTICIGPPCIRPDHLRVLSLVENSRRTYGRDWPLGQCVNGHPNSELVWSGKQHKQRRCRACHKIRMQRWNRLQTEKRRAAKAATT